MASVCMYLQFHQPPRLRRYSVFDSTADYFDQHHNGEIFRKVAERSYLPTARLLLKLLRKHDGDFRLSVSMTGVFVEAAREHGPEVLDLLQQMAETGCVEFLSETYYHSIAFLYSRDEFREQVEKHGRMIEQLFGQHPSVFRNTELIYNNDVAFYLASLDGFIGVLTEGADQILGQRNPNHLYRPPHTDSLALLLKNYRLSDDIAFRFSDRGWAEWPLTADKFARWVDQTNANGEVCNLFLNCEAFGEFQSAESGVFDFLEAMPRQIIDTGRNDFRTVSEAIESYDPVGDFDVPHMISWADTERDLSAWLGNAMQSNALHELFKLEPKIKATGDAELLADWRKLTCSDHFYYMCTKYYADGEVHKYFSPYESPYDSYINFMNVLDNLRTRAGG